jgi:hypothetical protein
MPNWKKVIVSGSDAALNSLLVSTSLTASGLTYPPADNGEESFIQTNGSGILTLQYVKTIYEEIYNGEATTLVKGTPVYVSGSVGAASTVYRADAGNPAKMPVILVAADTLAPAETGRGIALGLIKGVNTTGYTAGTEIYVGVGGGWTAIRPTGSAIVQVLGYVTKEGPGGQGVVLNPGPASLPNLNSGSVWVGNGSSTPTATPTSSLSVASASFALTASYALNGGGGPVTPTFPYTGSAIISGSLEITGSFSVNNGTATKIDTSVSQLIDDSGIDSVEWQNRYLLDIAGNTSVDWNNRSTLDSYGVQSVDWENRTLIDSATNNVIDFSGTSGLNIVNYRPTVELQEDTTQDQFTQNVLGTAVFNAAGSVVEVQTNIDTSVSSSFLVYLDTDGIWKRANQTTDTSTKMLGICIQPYNKGSVLTEGMVTVTTSSAILNVPLVAGTTFYGMPVYFTGSSAKLTTNKPTSGYVRVAGHMYYNSTTNSDYWIMRFNPSNDWYKI